MIEAQRTLAELVLAKGHVEEAERWALSAVETVGMQDMMSRSNVRMVLGLVRAAQGRDDEAELLLRRRSTRSRRPTTGTPSPSRSLRTRGSSASAAATTRRPPSRSGSTRCFSRKARRGSSERAGPGAGAGSS